MLTTDQTPSKYKKPTIRRSDGIKTAHNTSGFGSPWSLSAVRAPPLMSPWNCQLLEFNLGLSCCQRQHNPKKSNNLLSVCMVISGGLKIMTPLCGHTAHNSGFRMPGDLVGTCGLTGGPSVFTGQAVSRSTVCRLPFARLRGVQLKQLARAQGLFRAIAHQTAEAQCQTTQTNLPALVQLGLLIQEISTHQKRRNPFGTEFELPMPQTDISDFLALVPETISCLIGSFSEKKF